jgi:ribosomal protein S17E
METLNSLLILIGWIVTTGVPAVIAILKHMREKAYKRACSELIEVIEEFDSNGEVKDAVTRVVSKSARHKIINPYLKANGYAKRSDN